MTYAEARNGGPEGPIARSGAQHPRLSDDSHPVPLEEQREAGDVILVRVRQDDDVEPAVECRDPLVEEDRKPVGIGAPVDQDATSPGTLDEHGVALAHVEDRDPQPTVRSCERQRGSHDHERRPHPDREERGTLPVTARR